MWEVFCYSSLLEHGLGFDFQELQFDQVMVLWQVAQTCESLAGFCFAIVVDEPSWRERLWMVLGRISVAR